ncbi:MAG: hypothetical protein KatS3mg024_1811 [Armatimonadota bacterium]|nr:MAG: hypothetical protein KatS3mg024_1811 [Armatimonadota bacterium]
MGILAGRVRRKLEVFGTAVNVAGKGTHRLLLQDLTASQMAIYLDPAEQSQMTLPGVFAVATADANIVENDTFTVDGRTFTVRKVIRPRLKGEELCRGLLAW